MTTYVALANWTDQGARAISDSPRRLDAARKTLEEMGGRSRLVEEAPASIAGAWPPPSPPASAI
jgi:hypothetical protein